MKLALTMTHCSRPACTEASLHGLRGCAGLSRWTLLPRVEPVDPVVVLRVAEFCARRTRARVTVNPRRLGVNANTVAALDAAFADGADFVVHVEDDVVLARDALTYFAWCARRFASDPSIATATAYNRLAARPPRSTWHDVRTRVWFHPWAWGTWGDRWGSLRCAVTSAAATWDCQVNRAMIETCRREAFPTLSRAQNIGRVSSVHRGEHPPEWYDANHRLRRWAGDVVVPRGRFRTVTERAGAPERTRPVRAIAPTRAPP